MQIDVLTTVVLPTILGIVSGLFTNLIWAWLTSPRPKRLLTLQKRRLLEADRRLQRMDSARSSNLSVSEYARRSWVRVLEPAILMGALALMLGVILPISTLGLGSMFNPTGLFFLGMIIAYAIGLSAMEYFDWKADVWAADNEKEIKDEYTEVFGRFPAYYQRLSADE